MEIFKLLFLSLTIAVPAFCNERVLFWSYECKNGICSKVKMSEVTSQNPTSLSTCMLTCNGILGTVWPKPTGDIEIGEEVVQIKRHNIKFYAPQQPKVRDLWRTLKKRFEGQIDSKISDPTMTDGGRGLLVRFRLSQSSAERAEMPSPRLETDERYSLVINTTATEVVAEISARNFFGARHGLETLSQLIVFDDIRNELLTVTKVEITDAPKYKHRGIMIDTARNFISVKAIKRTIDAMAMTKLNTLHWHIIDSSSFPLVIKSQPDLHMIGAYTSRKIYTPEEIADLVDYARVRGVRIYPEMDMPAHVAEGWQLKDMAVCLDERPMQKCCRTRPWGQLDPTDEEVYDVLDDIYREVFGMFDLDMIHMGATQVDPACWQQTDHIIRWMTYRGWRTNTTDDFVRLWGYFQARAIEKIDKYSKVEKTPIIVWQLAKDLRDYNPDFLPNTRYIAQIGSTAEGARGWLRHGYRVIMSHYETYSLGCDISSTSQTEAKCLPAIGWPKLYDERFESLTETNHNLILGAEAVLFTKFTDEQTIDARLWPRASAMAERLWSNPPGNWKSAKMRMLFHRERLTENGIAAEALHPEWCVQNPIACWEL